MLQLMFQYTGQIGRKQIITMLINKSIPGYVKKQF